MVFVIYFLSFLILTVVVVVGEYDWDKYEQDIAIRRINTLQLTENNPFDFFVYFSINIWSNTTIEFLKTSKFTIGNIPSENFEIIWKDCTSCMDMRFGGGITFDVEGLDFPCVYTGSMMRFRILRNHNKGKE